MRDACRVDAGLLKPDAVRSGVSGGKAELTAKQEKALEKKEKVRIYSIDVAKMV